MAKVEVEAEAARGDRCAFDLGLGRFRELSLAAPSTGKKKRGLPGVLGRVFCCLLSGGWSPSLDMPRDSCDGHVIMPYHLVLQVYTKTGG